jgi:hypothetical protein
MKKISPPEQSLAPTTSEKRNFHINDETVPSVTFSQILFRIQARSPESLPIIISASAELSSCRGFVERIFR